MRESPRGCSWPRSDPWHGSIQSGRHSRLAVHHRPQPLPQRTHPPAAGRGRRTAGGRRSAVARAGGLGSGRRRCQTGCVSCWATTGTIRATAARSASWPLATCLATYSTFLASPRPSLGSDIMHRTFVRQKFDDGLEAADVGRTIPHDQVFEEFTNDRASCGPTWHELI